MSLIPFILDLADELHEFSRCLAGGNDDFGVGLYVGINDQQPTSAREQQQQQSSPRRRASSFSSSFWLPSKRHHPYNRIKSACCGKPLGDESGAVNIGITGTGALVPTGENNVVATTSGTPGKPASYSVVNKNGFQVSMNVKQFAPNELSVKTIDNCIVVEGRHDDKEDGHGVISRHFVRKYMLPKGYDPKDVLSTLSSDGILTVKAPLPPPPIAKNDEIIERVVAILPAPGPAQILAASPAAATKETTPIKEQQHAKKLLSPSARAECELPEKRQKLDVPQQQEQEQEKEKGQQKNTEGTQTLSKPAAQAETQTSTPTLSPSSSLPELNAVEATTESAVAAAAIAVTDVVVEAANEKAEKEKTVESDIKEKVSDNSAAATNNVTTKNVENEDAKEAAANAEPTTTTNDKQLNEKEAMEIDETENKTLGEKKLTADTNGTTNTAAAATKAESSSEGTESNAKSCLKSKDNEVPAESTNKDEGKADNGNKMEIDETEDDETAMAKNTTKNNNNVLESKPKAIENAAPNADNKTKNTKSNSTTTQNNMEKKDNTNTTGKTPADCANAVTNTTKVAESVAADGDGVEAAVLPPAKKIEIDDVALLKAAVTADATETTKADGKALLAEPMDGITTSDSTTAVVDKVECSALFSKSHLGNGNSATLVAKEEVAN